MDVWRTFALSYWRLNADDETDANAVRLLAHAARLMPGEPMPKELLALSLEPYGAPGTELTLPATLVRDALERSAEVGLLGEETDGAYGMHRLVAAFALAEIPDDGAYAAVEAACARAGLEAFQEGNPGRQELLLPHVRHLADAAMERVDEPAANLCTAAGDGLGQLGNYDEALPYAQRAVDITADLHGSNDRHTLQRRSNVGMLLKSMRDWDAARVVYEEVLEVQEVHLGREDIDVAATINNMGVLLRREDLYHEMLPLYRRALHIRERVWEKSRSGDPDRRAKAYKVAESHSNMGALMMDLGRPRLAGPHLDSALEIMRGEFGENHERNAGTLVMRGAALRALGLYLEAAASVRCALDVYEAVGMATTPAAGGGLSNLGSIFAELAEAEGVYEEQRPQLREMAAGWLLAALVGSEHGYGEDHPITGGLNRAYGTVRDAQGADEEARHHRERAEACRRLNLRGQDSEAAIAINEAGGWLVNWGLYDEAQVYLGRALAIRESILGGRTFDTSTSLFKLGILFQLRGRDAWARDYLERAWAARSDVCGEDHPATEIVRDNLRLLET
jgi:tetratricopeptide (TPR) repeat protein